MSQHDYVINNDSGASVRADINSALQAILSSNSGTSAPSSTSAGTLWLDTTGGLPYALKIRDGGNNHWLTIGTVDDPGADKGMELNPSKINLPSSGGVYESDGSTEILTESSGAVSLKNTTIDSTTTFPTGHIIKTYSQTFRGVDSNATNNYVIVGDGDADELEITTDTPKSTSSKFLIMVSIGAVSDTSGASTAFRLTRGGTFISESGSDDTPDTRTPASFRAGEHSTHHPHAVSFNFLDSPNSSTALTYAVTYANQSSITTTINYPAANADTPDTYGTRTASTLIIFEIA